uniref:Yip1 family protein n=1 Tax=Paractinoplanes polyasparticus TaxID=2856853 RepID=UPI001C864902|nr:Yip1 family protein [Actinoplanes polyasparticus]
MSDGEFLRYAGALAASGLLFLILAVLGVGQGLLLRALDVLAGLAFLGYAGYLMVVAPESPFMSWFVFATPVLGLAVAVIARRRTRARMKRLEEDLTSPYAAPAVTGHAERQPFPTPPPPLDPSAPAPAPTKHKRSDAPAKSTAMPSGLPPSGLGENPVVAEPRPPRPSGLPSLRSESGSPAHSEPGRPPAHVRPSSSTHAEPGWSAAHSPSSGPPTHAEPGRPSAHSHRSDRSTHAEPDWASAHAHPNDPSTHAEPDWASAQAQAGGSSTPTEPGASAWRGGNGPLPGHAGHNPALRPPAPGYAEPGYAEPGYRARHGASGDETAEHDYARGRHRSDSD